MLCQEYNTLWELKIVADQHGVPTWSHGLGWLVAHTIERMEIAAQRTRMTLAEAVNPLSGIHHACKGGSATWFGFAEEFLRAAPIPTEEYSTSAERPQTRG